MTASRAAVQAATSSLSNWLDSGIVVGGSPQSRSPVTSVEPNGCPLYARPNEVCDPSNRATRIHFYAARALGLAPVTKHTGRRPARTVAGPVLRWDGWSGAGGVDE